MPDKTERREFETVLVMLLVGVLATCLSVGCGDDMAMAGDEGADAMNEAESAPVGDDDDGFEDGDDDDSFEPEEEEFVVEQVASTESYVFVPNRSDGSDTVALIDGRDFSVRPIQVGLEPEHVQAADVGDQGAVAYVLSRGEPTVSIIRADAGEAPTVDILSVPSEVNALTVAPDGRHLLAYIDPDEPIDAGDGAASLQTLALVSLGPESGQDEVFELSVSPYIEDITFSDNGDQAFVVGEQGVHRLWLGDIKADMVVPPLGLEIDGIDMSAADREFAVAADGQTLAVRNGTDSGLGLFSLDGDDAEVEQERFVELDGVPTDLDLVEGEDSLQVVAPVRSQSQVVTFDVDEAMGGGDESSFLEIIDATGADAGIGRWTPDQTAMAVFSTVPEIPRVGLVDIATGEIDIVEFRNQIRNLEISPDSKTAVAVHRRQEGPAPTNTPEDQFRHSEGLTLWDLDTGFLRPVTLHGEPEQISMVTDDDGRAFLYVMLTPTDEPGADAQGLMRVNLATHATSFYSLPRLPTRLGAVAGKVFVSQKQDSGRITFFDIVTSNQHTVSGYELNAGIE